MRRAVTAAYNHVEPVQFLRTTYKAGPLVALALACLAGVAAAELWRRLPRTRCRASPLAVAGAALLGGRVLAARDGPRDRPEVQLRRGARRLGAGGGPRGLAKLGPNARALILPGQLYAFYDWGATVDPILPALAERPVTSKTAVPVLRPARGRRALDRGRRDPAGALRARPARGAARLARSGDGGHGHRRRPRAQRRRAADGGRTRAVAGGAAASRTRSTGRSALYEPALGVAHRAGAAAAGAPLRHRRARASSGWSRARGRALVDGSAEGVAALAAFGLLDRGEPLEYAGDLDAGELGEAVARRGRDRDHRLEPAPDRVALAPAPDLGPHARGRRGHPGGRARSSSRSATRAPTSRPSPSLTRRGVAALAVRVRLPAVPRAPAVRRIRRRPGDVVGGRPRAARADTAGSRSASANRATSRRSRCCRGGRTRRRSRRSRWRGAASRSSRAGTGSSSACASVDRLRVRITGRDLPEGRRGGPGALAEMRVPGCT